MTRSVIDVVVLLARSAGSETTPASTEATPQSGCTYDSEDIVRLAGFTAGPGNAERVDALPLHRMGAFKWKQLGIKYKLRDAEPPSKEIVERNCARFRSAGLKVY